MLRIAARGSLYLTQADVLETICAFVPVHICSGGVAYNSDTKNDYEKIATQTCRVIEESRQCEM